MPPKPVVMEVPGASSPAPGDPPTPPDPQPPSPQPGPEPERLDPREVLREAMANIGQGRHYGNALVDWLDANGYRIQIVGVKVDPPMRVFSEPDSTPAPEKEPFGLTDQVE